MSQNLATATYTLKQIKANILNKTGKLSTQDMKLIKPQFDAFIHDAVMLARTLMGAVLDDFYNTKVAVSPATITSGFGTVSIAVKSIADPSRIRLYDPTLGEIPIMPIGEFNAHRSQYTTSDMGTLCAIATILSTSAIADTPPYILNLAFYTGAATPLATVEMYYPRNPIKVVTEADTVDIPDHLCSIVEDMAAVTIMRKLERKPAQELDSRVAIFVKTQLDKMGIKSPIGN